jgi:hypothetical protein
VSFIDEDVLRDAGAADFARYAVDASSVLEEDIFLDAPT